jgi:23S rRNA G2445 N2-methylase RlmL
VNERFFAACTLGLEQVLAAELEALGAERIRAVRGGARFTGPRSLGYAACLWLRSAIRVQLQLGQRRVRDERELYGFVREQEWERFLRVDGTLAVDASLRDSFLTHSQFAAQLVKDAVVDRFRDARGARPSVDLKAPDLPIKLLLKNGEATLYVDLAGQSLHKRGYRDVQVKSPLNEALAAGLLLATGWDRRSPLLDPMCGSGTFAIEAVWLAGDRAPGLGRSFAFERWLDLDAKAWSGLFDEAEARAESGARSVPPIEAADRHAGALGIARRSAQAAGVSGSIRFVHSEVARLEPSVAPGIVVTNPPYGERLGEGEDLLASWSGLGELLWNLPQPCQAWVLSGNPELTRFLKLRASRKLPVRNGPIDCRWMCYEVGGRERGQPGPTDGS